MRRLVIAVGLATSFSLPVLPAKADPLQDVCAAKAERFSGYKPRGLSIGDRRGRLSLSGSVSVGVSTSSGPEGSEGALRGDRDSGADRKQDAKVRNYWKVFDDCMLGQ